MQAEVDVKIDRKSRLNNNNNNNNNNLICIAPACRMTSEALADSSSRATECLTEK